MKKDKVKQEWDEHRASIVKECAMPQGIAGAVRQELGVTSGRPGSERRKR